MERTTSGALGRALALGCGFLAMGCSGAFNPSADGETSISELSDPEVVDLCEDAARFLRGQGIESIADAKCEFDSAVALLDDLPMLGPEAAEALCFANAESCGISNPVTLACRPGAAPNCMATVDEYAECLTDRVAEERQTYNAFGCRDLRDEMVESPPPFRNPSICDDIFNQTGCTQRILPSSPTFD